MAVGHSGIAGNCNADALVRKSTLNDWERVGALLSLRAVDWIAVFHGYLSSAGLPLVRALRQVYIGSNCIAKSLEWPSSLVRLIFPCL